MTFYDSIVAVTDAFVTYFTSIRTILLDMILAVPNSISDLYNYITTNNGFVTIFNSVYNAIPTMYKAVFFMGITMVFIFSFARKL